MVILVAGFVTSKNDGQEHYISGRQLARLYRLPSNTPVKVTTEAELPRIMLGLDSSKVLVLRPNYHGQYTLTPEQRALL